MVDTPIGTNSPNYTLVSGDLGATIYCRVTATNASGSSNAISNVVGPITAAALPANAGGANLPNIADTTPEVTVAVSCTTGTWTGDPTITYSYQWKRGGTNVGTNSASYTPVVGDIGATLQCVVTATNGAGSASATSNTTGAVAAAPAGQVATWNPARKGDAFVLSNGNKTATCSLGGWSTVLGTTSRNSGKHYLEFKMIIVSSTDETWVMMGVGVDEGQSMNAIVGGSFYMGVTGGGTSWVVGSSNDPPPWTVVVNDIVQMAIDFDTRKAWVGLNNTWSGDPVAATGEWMNSTTGPAWTAGMALFPWMDTIVEEFSIELKTAASSQTYAPPTGFSRWE